MINRLYGILAPEALASAAYYRRSTQPRATVPELQVLIPQTTEKAYIQYCADQLVRLSQLNQLTTVLQELDPDNTYERQSTQITDDVTNIAGVPAAVALVVVETNRRYPWVEQTIHLSFDGVTTVTYDGNKTAEWGATGTPLMPVAGLALQLNGAPPAAFTATVELTRRPSRDLLDLLDHMDKLEGLEWDARLEPYKDATVPTTRLVAYVLNALAKI